MTERKSEFLRELDIKDLHDGVHFRLDEPLDYYSAGLLRTLRAPAGFVTDFASIPRPFRWFLPRSGPYNRAAVMHDAAYNHALTDTSGFPVYLSKQAADNLFHEAMLVCGVGSKKAKTMYLAVHYFGRPQPVPTVA